MANAIARMSCKFMIKLLFANILTHYLQICSAKMNWIAFGQKRLILNNCGKFLTKYSPKRRICLVSWACRLELFSFVSIISIFFNWYFVDINECASNPCQNGGSCQDGTNRYTCRCLPGYAGSRCQVGKFIILINKYERFSCFNSSVT